jgi:hypothetical protein
MSELSVSTELIASWREKIENWLEAKANKSLRATCTGPLYVDDLAFTRVTAVIEKTVRVYKNGRPIAFVRLDDLTDVASDENNLALELEGKWDLTLAVESTERVEW